MQDLLLFFFIYIFTQFHFFLSGMKLYLELKELVRGCEIGKEKNLTHVIMSKNKQYPADNQNFKACEKKAVCIFTVV